MYKELLIKLFDLKTNTIKYTLLFKEYNIINIKDILKELLSRRLILLLKIDLITYNLLT